MYDTNDDLLDSDYRDVVLAIVFAIAFAIIAFVNFADSPYYLDFLGYGSSAFQKMAAEAKKDAASLRGIILLALSWMTIMVIWVIFHLKKIIKKSK